MTGYLQESDGLSFYQSPLLAGFPELVHGFFTRRGGVSLAPYDSLNLSLSVGDRREAAVANRRRVQQALGLAWLASAHQVHGQGEAVITENPAEPNGETGNCGYPVHRPTRRRPAHQAG